jgi:DNA-binding response OmpR family regulator
MKILVVEDNERLAERIQYRLNKFFLTDIVGSGEEALEKIKNVKYDVITLDLGLPDLSGFEVCNLIRQKDLITPILILSGATESNSKVAVLDSGADDYLTKPFDVDELRARIIALARRKNSIKLVNKVTHGDLEIDMDNRKVIRNGQIVILRRKEYDILEYLITNTGRILTREMILDHAWENNKSGWKSTVDVHIKHLRDKIDKPFSNKLIKTCYGVGYTIEPIG